MLKQNNKNNEIQQLKANNELHAPDLGQTYT